MNKKLILLSLSCTLLPCLVTAQHSRISINSESGYSIQWNGNNGNHFNPETGAESPENDAFNAYSFASSNYFPDGEHDAANVIDGYSACLLKNLPCWNYINLHILLFA